MKERCGIPKRAARRNAQMAFDKGLDYESAKGKLKKYIDSKNGGSAITDVRIWSGNVYVFSGEELLTVYHLPKKYTKREIQMRQKRKLEGEMRNGTEL